MLYDRMHKIEELQQLQRRYHEELRKMKQEAEGEEERTEEQANDMPEHATVEGEKQEAGAV